MNASDSAGIFRLGRGLSIVALLLAAQSAAECRQAPATADATLKATMARYEHLTSYQAECGWIAAINGQTAGAGADRKIWYSKPNRFKIVSSQGRGSFVQTSVSDGKKLVDFATGIDIPAQNSDAPRSIADAASMQMVHPMFCGSLLYLFFGGPGKFSALVDAKKMPIAFGPKVTLDSQTCNTVRFWAKGMTYGKTEVAIGSSDGLVHRIRYGSEPLMQMMRSAAMQKQIQRALNSPEFKKNLPKGARPGDVRSFQSAMSNQKNTPITSLTTENYTHIAVNQPIDPAVFAAKAPEGKPVDDMSVGAEPQSPVPLGQPAPDISVVSPDGVRHRLADFKGRVVLIDFWATWCPPCRKGLPETQRFHTLYGRKGLAVLAVSDEPKGTIMPFVKQNKYTFPVYIDEGSVTNKAYHVEAIPTVVVIDAKGNLAAYKVGLSPRAEILAALKKAGLQTQ